MRISISQKIRNISRDVEILTTEAERTTRALWQKWHQSKGKQTVAGQTFSRKYYLWLLWPLDQVVTLE